MTMTTATSPRIAIARARALDDYETSVRRAGGTPWLVTPGEQTPDQVLAEADGLLLLGGDDVDPAIYGEAAHPTTQRVEAERDAFEIALIRRAVEADLPVLAICRGLQVLNVALGGTLIQDIPSQHAGQHGGQHAGQQADAIAHALDPRVKEAEPREIWKARVAHPVIVSPSSRLAALLPEPRAREVNSRHHQAVKRVADSLTVTATAPDGIVEAIERPASTFVIGVQWHPENFIDERSAADTRAGDGDGVEPGSRFLGLFRGFVQAAQSRRRGANRG